LNCRSPMFLPLSATCLQGFKSPVSISSFSQSLFSTSVDLQ
jgi:hypothetical protein